MVTASCHCGAIQLEVTYAPTEVTECNCSICRRYGALWAYYAPDQVRMPTDGATDSYAWDDRSISFHRCKQCGCVTHWSSVDSRRVQMGVNARMLDPQIVANARMRHLDGAVTERYVD